MRPALAVLPLTVPVVQSPLLALLVPAIGATSLPESHCFAAGMAAIAMSAVTVRADQEGRATLRSRTKPLSQNHFAVFRHVSRQAGMDNGNGFVAPLDQLVL
jgi:hypothetical protein